MRALVGYGDAPAFRNAKEGSLILLRAKERGDRLDGQRYGHKKRKNKVAVQLNCIFC